uniref:Uncharacterized protein n=1 Tax=Panthera tigris altaica TaxID=74533 RepID=A0A8C9MCY3_PANTA
MEGEEEEGGPLTQTLLFPLQADTEPVVPVGSSEVVPRVLSGEPQNQCACSLTPFSAGGPVGVAPRRRLGLCSVPTRPLTLGPLPCRTGSCVGPHHRAAGHGPWRRVQGGLQGGGPGAGREGGLSAREPPRGSGFPNQRPAPAPGVMSGLMQMLLLKVSAHITEQLGMAPGGEFREAFKEASRGPFCKFHLGDRPIPVTFKRAIAALSFWQKVKLAWGLCFLSDPIR